jgi:ATP-dependent Clp protease adaptor protein ClpS
MEFVIQLLIEVFNKSIDDASSLTLAIHEQGKANVGFYTYEVAEQKVNECSVICSYHGHPLKVTMEEI